MLDQIIDKSKLIFLRLGWRSLAVIAAAVLAVAITGTLYYFGISTDPATHVGAVFSSWVGGVAIFIFAGAVAAIVTIIPPESGSFDSRARILFRGQSGAHIDYIVTRIQDSLEQYAQSTDRVLTFSDFHEGTQKFYVESATKTQLRNYVDDTDSVAKSKLSVAKTRPAPPGMKAQRLTFVRVNGEPVCEATTYDDSFEVEFDTPVSRGGVGVVETYLENWIDTGEPCLHRPLRYTQALGLSVENRTDRRIRLTVKALDRPETTHILRSGETRSIVDLKDVNPKVVAYDLSAAID